MSAIVIEAPPISITQFLKQTYLDEEWHRDRAWTGSRWITYSRGVHGGFDSQAVDGDLGVHSPTAGIVRYVNYGDYLGTRQFVVARPDGAGWFAAHTATRLREGTRVEPGDYVARMGNNSSTSIGVHLHDEWLARWGDWRSTVNHGAQYRALQDKLRKGQALTPEQMKELKAYVDSRALWTFKSVIRALTDGYVTEKLDDDKRAKYQELVDRFGGAALRAAITESAAAGTDPDVIEAACERALRAVFKDAGE